MALFLAGFAAFCPSEAAFSAAPDPILTGGAPGPCDPRLDRPDYVPGTDSTGYPVAPADTDGGVGADLSHAQATPILGRHGKARTVVSGVRLKPDADACPRRKPARKPSP